MVDVNAHLTELAITWFEDEIFLHLDGVQVTDSWAK